MDSLPDGGFEMRSSFGLAGLNERCATLGARRGSSAGTSGRLRTFRSKAARLVIVARSVRVGAAVEVAAGEFVGRRLGAQGTLTLAVLHDGGSAGTDGGGVRRCWRATKSMRGMDVPPGWWLRLPRLAALPADPSFHPRSPERRRANR